jgi:AcrR family transcriptional regulator
VSVRQRILDAGVRLLHDEGFAALTQPRIARAAGASQSHLTYYFPTRADLLLAIAEHSVDEVLSRLAVGDGDPRALLLDSARYLPRVRMLLGLVSAADQDPALRPALDRLVAHVRTSLSRLLQALGHAGDPAQVAALHGALIGLALLNLGRQSTESAADVEAGVSALLDAWPIMEQRGRRSR